MQSTTVVVHLAVRALHNAKVPVEVKEEAPATAGLVGVSTLEFATQVLERLEETKSVRVSPCEMCGICGRIVLRLTRGFTSARILSVPFARLE